MTDRSSLDVRLERLEAALEGAVAALDEAAGVALEQSLRIIALEQLVAGLVGPKAPAELDAWARAECAQLEAEIAGDLKAMAAEPAVTPAAEWMTLLSSHARGGR